jgi:chemotaxis response regulator CheB
MASFLESSGIPLYTTPVRRPQEAEGTMAIRVLITDGSPAIRDMIRRHLECIGCDIVAEAETAAQALPLFRTVRPEIVAIGTQLSYSGQPNPFDLVRVIKREAPETSVLMIGSILSPEEANLFLRAGALECFVVPFEFASLWRTLSIAHPELTSRTFGTMMSNAATIKASRVSR